MGRGGLGYGSDIYPKWKFSLAYMSWGAILNPDGWAAITIARWRDKTVSYRINYSAHRRPMAAPRLFPVSLVKKKSAVTSNHCGNEEHRPTLVIR